MNKHQFNKWLMGESDDDYNIQAHAWFNNRTESGKRALKSKWYAGLKRFQIGYLLKAGIEIKEVDEIKPEWPNEHLQALLDKCHKLSPRPNTIPVITPPTEEEKKELLETTKKCRQIVMELAGGLEAPEPAPEDDISPDTGAESEITDRPTQGESEAQNQSPQKRWIGRP